MKGNLHVYMIVFRNDVDIFFFIIGESQENKVLLRNVGRLSTPWEPSVCPCGLLGNRAPLLAKLSCVCVRLLAFGASHQ